MVGTDEETEAELSQASWPQIPAFEIQLVCSWHQVLKNGGPRELLCTRNVQQGLYESFIGRNPLHELQEPEARVFGVLHKHWFCSKS